LNLPIKGRDPGGRKKRGEKERKREEDRNFG